MRVLPWVVGLLTMFSCDILPAQANEEVLRLVHELGDDDYATRERASARLAERGAAALPWLAAATNDDSAEVRYRAGELIQQIRLADYRAEIEAFCAQPDEALDVEHGMWLIARILNPAVRKEDLDKQLDDIAALVQAKLGADVDPAQADPEEVVAALCSVLFEDLKFTGNQDDFDNPDNNSLERVLATRKGLPILLAHLTVAVARRLDVPVVGLSVIGHYTVKYDGSRAPKGFDQKDIFFHPYDGGRLLTRADRVRMYSSHDPDVLVPPATSRQALIRMLNNLTSDLRGDSQRAEQLRMAMDLLEALRTHDSSPATGD